MKFEDYPFHLSPIPPEEGGGYLITFPDLPGCLADGSTMEEAIAQARDAFQAWVMAETEDQGRLPAPKSSAFVESS